MHLAEIAEGDIPLSESYVGQDILSFLYITIEIRETGH